MLHCIDSNLNIEVADYEEMLDKRIYFSYPVISGVYVLFCKSKIYGMKTIKNL